MGYGFCIEFVVYLLTKIDEVCPSYIYVISHVVDKPIKEFGQLSLWQFILRRQLPYIDIKRFFYSFGPLIGKYKTVISPPHLAARKLMELSRGKESHITDGDVDAVITPQTILRRSPRILKQILSAQK